MFTTQTVEPAATRRGTRRLVPTRSDKMVNINYLLYESAAGYAIFEVVNQADSIGLQLKEVQNSLKNLATFSKHVKLVNFTPYRYALVVCFQT